MLPVLDAPASAYAAVRDALTAAGYTAAGVCARLDVPDVFGINLGEQRQLPGTPDALDLLLHLFVQGAAVDEAELRRAIGDDAVSALRMLRLVRPDSMLHAAVALYPVEDLWLISDLVDEATDVEDAVYPAITTSVRVFLAALPDMAGRRVLELCSGTGVAALLAARRGAREAVAVDITARASHFAAFNARLNDLPLTVRQGDLYAPVAGEQFDVILAHPPYVPAMHTRAIFRDGGADGEQVTRGVLAAAAAHLAPEGVLLCTAMLSDRRGGSAVDRVRDAVGAAAGQTDILLLSVADLNGDSAFIPQLFRAAPEALPDLVAGWRYYRSLDITHLRLTTTILRRHAGDRPSICAGITAERRIGWPVVAWLLAAQQLRWQVSSDPARWLAAHPRLNRAARFRQRFAYQAGADPCFQPVDGTLSIDHPVPTAVTIDSEDAARLGSLDGTRSVEALWEEYRAKGIIPAGVPLDAFLGSLVPLFVTGVLETELLPFPPMP